MNYTKITKRTPLLSAKYCFDDISLERNIVVANFRQNDISARYCLDIAELSVSCEGNPSDISRRYLRNITRTKRDISRISLALLLHNTVCMG